MGYFSLDCKARICCFYRCPVSCTTWWFPKYKLCTHEGRDMQTQRLTCEPKLVIISIGKACKTANWIGSGKETKQKRWYIQEELGSNEQWDQQRRRGSPNNAVMQCKRYLFPQRYSLVSQIQLWQKVPVKLGLQVLCINKTESDLQEHVFQNSDTYVHFRNFVFTA